MSSKTHILSLILTSLLITRAATMPDGTCLDDNGEMPVYLPDTDNCGIFYECFNGMPVVGECMDGLLFNAANDTCDFPENTPCYMEGGNGDGDERSGGSSLRDRPRGLSRRFEA